MRMVQVPGGKFRIALKKLLSEERIRMNIYTRSHVQTGTHVVRRNTCMYIERDTQTRTPSYLVFFYLFLSFLLGLVSGTRYAMPGGKL